VLAVDLIKIIKVFLLTGRLTPSLFNESNSWQPWFPVQSRTSDRLWTLPGRHSACCKYLVLDDDDDDDDDDGNDDNDDDDDDDGNDDDDDGDDGDDDDDDGDDYWLW